MAGIRFSCGPGMRMSMESRLSQKHNGRKDQRDQGCSRSWMLVQIMLVRINDK